eukprot:CAMPEP_0202882784 /NCGR_PEP_ID=MMETSP1391-20130828/38515_1 /ASSEMBLY_ACC=CAM_ASM_000867 /TAXON_ID=1034604 /ORGANISM="Chlamydomonas leiostraca, Strain SAG 11-49" /LENGTH=39 /DNA_ID= /DNA_START= /DNA_END= /DNA_ORIENTATION=
MPAAEAFSASASISSSSLILSAILACPQYSHCLNATSYD